ncbi:Hypothetical predicted protein [Marmota monax]|uniref:Uncharacterized protein n=1 Tax=Marmota monax TaxID=9995 RepID=A0A5E4AUW4_MARMO|nr:hypothetical protein GHT09_018367 [Marmota monax]VTJ61188.1 Hypothetical predicted protein [Marmota monax]
MFMIKEEAKGVEKDLRCRRPEAPAGVLGGVCQSSAPCPRGNGEHGSCERSEVRSALFPTISMPTHRGTAGKQRARAGHQAEHASVARGFRARYSAYKGSCKENSQPAGELG